MALSIGSISVAAGMQHVGCLAVFIAAALQSPALPGLPSYPPAARKSAKRALQLCLSVHAIVAVLQLATDPAAVADGDLLATSLSVWMRELSLSLELHYVWVRNLMLVVILLSNGLQCPCPRLTPCCKSMGQQP